MPKSFNLIRSLTEQRDQEVIIWLFNIGAEKYWNAVAAGVTDRTENRIVNRVEEMNVLLCREQDVMIIRELPDEQLLEQLSDWGFSIPQFRVPAGVETDPDTPIAELVLQDEELCAELAHLAAQRHNTVFVPYAVTEIEEKIAARCGLVIPHASSDICAAINDKIANRLLALQLGLPVCAGEICSSIAEIEEVYTRLTSTPPYFTKVIIKDPFGASGKGLYIIEDKTRLQALLNRLNRAARNRPESRWLVEGWYSKKADLNYQVYVAPNGEIDVFSIKQQVLRDTVYIGSVMPPELDDATLTQIQAYGTTIGKRLFELGYSGVAGIDAIITDNDELMPIIEINGRFTLSTYISFVDRILGKAIRFSRYFRIQSDHKLSYRELVMKLKEADLAYDHGSGRGVLLYTAGSLPLRQDEATGRYTGRMFVLLCGSSREEVEALNNRLEQFVSRNLV